jgi:putative transposase
MYEIVEKHRSHGPHYQFRDSIIFLTWRLAFTLPSHVTEYFKLLNKTMQEIRSQDDLDNKKKNLHFYERFDQYDSALAGCKTPDFSLNDVDIAAIVKNSFHFYDGKKYLLHAYCLMSNHVHLVIMPIDDGPGEAVKVSTIVQFLKRYTAREITRVRNRKIRVWEHYYFDRFVRDYEDYGNVIGYVLNNPVKAGLVTVYSQWKDSYYNPDLL